VIPSLIQDLWVIVKNPAVGLSRFFDKYRKLVFFVLVGGVEALLGFAGLFLLSGRLGWPHDSAYLLVTVVAFEVNFGLNFLVTWKMPTCEFWPCLLKFHLAKGILVFVAQGLFSFATDVLGANYLGVYVAVLVPLTLVSFRLNDAGVFVVTRRVES